MSLQEALDQGIRAAFEAESERAGIIAAWTLQTELAAVDGELYLHTISSRDLMPWRALGLVDSHAADLRAHLTRPVEDS